MPSDSRHHSAPAARPLSSTLQNIVIEPTRLCDGGVVETAGKWVLRRNLPQRMLRVAAPLTQARCAQAGLAQARLYQVRLDQARLNQVRLDQARLDQALLNQALLNQ